MDCLLTIVLHFKEYRPVIQDLNSMAIVPVK